MRFIKWYEKSIHDARSIAKAFGGKALKGTAKQKEGNYIHESLAL